MKFGKLFCLSLFSLFIITGCGDDRKLECVKSNNDSTMNINQKTVTTFNNDDLKKISIKMDVEIKDIYTDHEDGLIDSVKSQFQAFIGQNGFKDSITKKDNAFTFELDVDLNKVSDDIKSKIDFVNIYHDYVQTKNEFESKGYSCK